MTWDDLKQHEIKVYSTPWCGDCRRFKKTLEQHGVDFEEVDIDADPKAADHLVEQTGKRAIPYAEIDGAGMVRGYHKDQPGRWDDETFLAEVEEALS